MIITLRCLSDKDNESREYKKNEHAYFYAEIHVIFHKAANKQVRHIKFASVFYSKHILFFHEHHNKSCRKCKHYSKQHK